MPKSLLLRCARASVALALLLPVFPLPVELPPLISRDILFGNPERTHPFARPENRIDFNARAEKFLAGCLAGRFEPTEGERVPGSTAVVKVVGK